ncbi:MAG TPA: hypothetical protein VK031_01990 [Tissierellaceae bacterium]|nr:hypothetical protein [Tissierellaceae bacterium]
MNTIDKEAILEIADSQKDMIRKQYRETLIDRIIDRAALGYYHLRMEPLPGWAQRDLEVSGFTVVVQPREATIWWDE